MRTERTLGACQNQSIITAQKLAMNADLWNTLKESLRA